MSNDLRHQLGHHGEDLAAEHLLRRGFDILERNFRTRWGELDIIAFDGLALVFCEVKTRRMWHGAAGATPLAAVNATKQVRLRKMAGRWLVERRDRPYAAELRFDAIGITFDASGQFVGLEHIEGAF